MELKSYKRQGDKRVRQTRALAQNDLYAQETNESIAYDDMDIETVLQDQEMRERLLQEGESKIDKNQLQKQLHKYNGWDENALINELLKNIEAQKKQGTFDKEQLVRFAMMMGGMLSEQQQKKLENIIRVIDDTGADVESEGLAPQDIEQRSQEDRESPQQYIEQTEKEYTGQDSLDE
ncbi:MAG: hypothetical protein FWD76_04840 [Firmicutes bacterium]|nr:hypothetical protein [Bacillota bacterium]